jgi:hypothetical protein
MFCLQLALYTINNLKYLKKKMSLFTTRVAKKSSLNLESFSSRVTEVSWNKSPTKFGMRKTSFRPTEPRKTSSRKTEPILQATLPYNNVFYQLVRNKYLSTRSVGFLDQLNNIWSDDRLNSIQFHGTTYGRVEYFKNCLIESLGQDWSDRVLDPADDLSNVQTVERLGKPGREGTTIKINCDGIDYAVKVAKKGTYCGSGVGQTLAEEQEEEKIHGKGGNGKGPGFLHQARLQQLASQYKVTVPVEAVHCGGEDEVSFIVMLPLKTRLVDYYNPGDTLSLKHQKQLWELFKTLDEDVGIFHCDYNCLNIMIDSEENVRLIDFDRAVTIDRLSIVKYGPYPNLSVSLGVLNCFTYYKISPGQKLLANYHRLFGSKFKTGININNIRTFRQMSRNGEYNFGRGEEYRGTDNKKRQTKEVRKTLTSRLIPYETLGINWDQLPEAAEREAAEKDARETAKLMEKIEEIPVKKSKTEGIKSGH